MAHPTPVHFPFSPLDDYDYAALEAVDVSQFRYSTLEPVSVHPVEGRRQVDAQPAYTEAGDVKAGKATDENRRNIVRYPLILRNWRCRRSSLWESGD